MKVQATIDLPSAKKVDEQIRALEKSISKLKVSGKFDDTALKNLTNQLNYLKVNIGTANFSSAASKELTNQINNSLKSVGLPGIDLGSNVAKNGQQIGTNIANNIADGISKSSGKVSAEVQKIANQVNKIQLLSNGGIKNDYTTQLAVLEGRFSKLGFKEDEIAKKTLNVNTAFNDLKQRLSQPFDESNFQEIITLNDKLQKELIESQNELTRLGASIKMATDSSRLNSVNQMQKWADNNGKAMKKWGEQINGFISQMGDLSNPLTKLDSDDILREFKKIQAEAIKTGSVGMTTSEKFSNAWNKIGGWSLVTGAFAKIGQAGRELISNVSKIDTSLVELSKVSDLTADGLEKVTDKSFELGRSLSKTGTDVLDAVTNFKRAGYDIADSMEYAEEALKTTNISENLKDAGQAADSLVNIMKGFRNESPEFARKINDSVNQVSNTEAVDFDNLIDGATRLSAVADQAGMSFEQMLGTLTGGYEILGNMEKVATGQITIFSRLQAIQLDGEEEVSTVAKLQETFNNATKGAVNIVDQTTGQLRNVFYILDDLANVWDSLDKNTREALAIEASGIRQKNVFLAMMQNWEGVKDAVESASNSFGSADEENEKYIQSIQGRVENFERSVQQLSRTLIDSDLVKFFVDLGTTGVNAIDKIVDKFGSLGTIGLGTGLFAGLKNVGNPKMFGFSFV